MSLSRRICHEVTRTTAPFSISQILNALAVVLLTRWVTPCGTKDPTTRRTPTSGKRNRRIPTSEEPSRRISDPTTTGTPRLPVLPLHLYRQCSPTPSSKGLAASVRSIAESVNFSYSRSEDNVSTTSMQMGNPESHGLTCATRRLSVPQRTSPRTGPLADGEMVVLLSSRHERGET